MKNYQQLKTEALEAFSQHGKVGQTIVFPKAVGYFTLASSKDIKLLVLDSNSAEIKAACEDL